MTQELWPPQLFQPGQSRGIRLHFSLSRCFGDGLASVFEACTPHLEFDPVACNELVARLRAGSRESPYLYSLYFRLVEAIRQDRLDDARVIIDTLASQREAATGISMVSLCPGDFPWDPDTVIPYFEAEDGGGFRMIPPTRQDADAMKQKLASALDLLRQTVPDLAAEAEELITSFILVAGEPRRPEDAETLDFEGVSALRAFGGLAINTRPGRSVAACALTIVHETAHNVLFALSPNEGVVTNADEERYASPLRIDPRPMEGIYHATFVLARMVQALDEMRRNAPDNAEVTAYADEMLPSLIERYADGAQTVRQHGRLTWQGEAAFAQAETYMHRHVA